MPQYVAGLVDVVRNPVYATGVGLLLFGQKNRGQGTQELLGRGQSGMWSRMKSWFQGNL
jgi:cell division protein FtsA